MKNTQLTHGLLIALLLGTSVASAQDYPAANFQPKVLYQDPSIAATAPVAAGSTSAPCDSKEAKAAVQAEVDPKYPAASFQPKVIFSN